MTRLSIFKAMALLVVMAGTLSTASAAAETATDQASPKRSEAVKAAQEQRAEKVAETQAARTEKVEQQQAKQTEKRQQTKQKVCENRKKGLTTKFSSIVTNSERIQAKIDGILDKALAYQQSNNVTAENFETLKANAQAAKTQSAASIAELKTVTPTVDCTAGTAAQDVKTFKVVAATVRDDLKAYKASVKALLKALKATKTSGEGGSDESQ